MPYNYYIGPDGTVERFGGSHFDWVLDAVQTQDPKILPLLTESNKTFLSRERVTGGEREQFVYDIMEKMLQNGWVRVTMQDDVNVLAIEGKWERIRQERQFLENLIGAEDLDYVDFGIVREHRESLTFGVMAHDINTEGIVRAMNDARRVEGYMVSDLMRRPTNEQVFVKGHRRKKIGVYPEGRYYRERIMNPSKCQPGSMRTKDIGRPGGHKAVICRPKGKKTTRTQSLLHPRTVREARKLRIRHRRQR